MTETERLRDYYSKSGEQESHQLKMYRSGDAFYRWYQGKRWQTVWRLLDRSGVDYQSPGSVLDLGTAEGMYLGRFGGGRLVGVDLALPKLRRAWSQGRKKEDYVNADAAHLPFRGGAFDVVLCVDVIRFTTSPSRVLQEMRRVSRQTVVVQSNTDFLSRRDFLARKPVRRPVSTVERELDKKSFSGAIWKLTPASFLSLAGPVKGQPGPTIRDTTALLPLHVILRALLRGAMRGSNSQNSTPRGMVVADWIQDRLGDRFPFNRLGVYTTVRLEFPQS